MLRVALIGYGKMGKTVERVAREQSCEIVHVMDIEDNPMNAGFQGQWVRQTDVMIDFSVPSAVPVNIQNAVDAGIPIIVGTTGWYDELDAVRRLVENRGGACLYSGNFSLGVQILFRLVREAGKAFSPFSDFHPFMVEMHHAQKLDAPSGTALTLVKILKESYGKEIPVSSVRAGSLPGTHVIGFDSPVDTLTLEHTARSREGFARGALYAARWMQGKKGLYRFEDVIFGESHE